MSRAASKQSLRQRSDGGAGTTQLWDWLLNGPDPVDPAEPVGLLEVLLPWPVRVLLVLSAIITGFALGDSGFGQQISWGLQAGALALIGIATGLWWQVLIIDSALAFLWFVPFRPRAGRGLYWNLLHVITFLNRQVGHLWVTFVWLVIALASFATLPVQAGGVVGLLLLGAPIVNWAARLHLPVLDVDGTGKASGDLLWRRRLIFYGATSVGWLWLILDAPHQLARLAPLVLAWGVGAALRAIRHYRRTRTVSVALEHAGSDDADASIAARAHFRRQQADVARQADPWGALVLPVALVAVIVFSAWQRRALHAAERQRSAEALDPVGACGQRPNAPLAADIALFLLADAQTHELAGEPFPGQTEIAQVFVSSSSRPVALDVLGTISLRQFASTYGTLNQARVRQQQAPVAWAHLGDMADISCVGELDRLRTELRALDELGPFAGVALGNHEMSFQGSFHWGPYWDTACASGRLEKDATSQRLAEALGPALERAGGQHIRLATPLGSGRGGSLSMVSPLGEAHHAGRTRGVVGIFLDTNDGRAFDWGMPGSVGSVSAAQLDAVRAAVARVRSSSTMPYQADPAYVVFSHIPFAALATASRRRVAEWLVELDDRQGDLTAEPRVLAFISAHTHQASTEQHCIGNRRLRQITIGSTLDPPQQAAVVELGADPEGRLALSLHALQSVERSETQSCGAAPRTSSAVCHQVAHQLARERACRAALGLESNNDDVARDCQELEQSSSLSERFSAIQTYDGPRDPDARRVRDQQLATQLLTCICRDGGCQIPDAPLDHDAYRQPLDALWSRVERRPELVCLSWAASVSQAHKAAGMSLGEALRCAFDDPTLPAERIYVATLEPSPCYQ